MTNLVYIGNKLQNKGVTATTIDILGPRLESLGFIVRYASNKRFKVWRLLDMLYTLIKYRNTTHLVLIDTYSTLNFYYASACSQLCRLLHLKYIPILHGGNLPNRLKQHARLSTAIFTHAYKLVSPSLYLENAFKASGYKHLQCIPNAIRLEDYQFLERNFNSINLLWVRSFSEIYNPKLAINILKALKDIGVVATLCMVGPEKDGSLEQCKIYANSLGLDVVFTGSLTKHEWITLSKYYNIFINTTHFDNMPVSVVEAMALGLPVISTQVGGMPYLIDNGTDGLLVADNDLDGFIKAILEVKTNEEKTKQMVEKARLKASTFNWDVVKKMWKGLLDS